MERRFVGQGTPESAHSYGNATQHSGAYSTDMADSYSSQATGNYVTQAAGSYRNQASGSYDSPLSRSYGSQPTVGYDSQPTRGYGSQASGNYSTQAPASQSAKVTGRYGGPVTGSYDNSNTNAAVRPYGDTSNPAFHQKGQMGKKGQKRILQPVPITGQGPAPIGGKQMFPRVNARQIASVNMDDDKIKSIRQLLSSLKPAEGAAGGYQASTSTSQDSNYAYSWGDSSYQQQQPWTNTTSPIKSSGLESYTTTGWDGANQGPGPSASDTRTVVQQQAGGEKGTEFMATDDDCVYQTGAGTVAGYGQSKQKKEDEISLDKAMQDRMKLLSTQSLDFIKVMELRSRLTAFNSKDKIVETIQSSQVVVVSGETGSGKTTQVPQYILDEYIDKGMGSQCRIICTQPKRVSAISVAERVAEERCETLDSTGFNTVGYQIRLESKLPRAKGSILFCTPGTVLSYLQEDPTLQRATHLIVDEVHERDMYTDFLLIILRELARMRPNLKVILLCSSLHDKMFSEYFGECPLVQITGFPFPVQEYCLEEALALTKYQPPPEEKQSTPEWAELKKRHADITNEEKFQEWCTKRVATQDADVAKFLQTYDFSYVHLDLILYLIKYLMNRSKEGAILVFLPGWEEIQQLRVMIKQFKKFRMRSLMIIPVHSLMPSVSHRELYERPPAGIRKIILATSLAESCVTIEDVVYVIDSGKVQVKNFHPEANIMSNDLQWVSKACSKLRAGRAGRITSGHCFHLFTSFHYYTVMKEKLPAEMLRSRLEELCLQVKLLKLGHIAPFISEAIGRPSTLSIQHAIDTLQDLNALDQDEELLPLGYLLAKMPVEPQLAKMILMGAIFGCLNPILTVAACLSYRDVFMEAPGYEDDAQHAKKSLSIETKSDHITIMNAFEGWEQSMESNCSGDYCWRYFLSEESLQHIYDLKTHLAALLHDMGFIETSSPKDVNGNVNSDNPSMLRAILCAGLYPNVAEITRVSSYHAPGLQNVVAALKNQSKLTIHPVSVNSVETFFESKFVVYYSKVRTNKMYIQDCTMVSPFPLLFFGGNIGVKMDRGQEQVTIDDWIIFNMPYSTANMAKELRANFNQILYNKVNKPCPTSWDPKTKEGTVMSAIADFITEEPAGSGVPGDGSIGVPY